MNEFKKIKSENKIFRSSLYLLLVQLFGSIALHIQNYGMYINTFSEINFLGHFSSGVILVFATAFLAFIISLFKQNEYSNIFSKIAYIINWIFVIFYGVAFVTGIISFYLLK